MTTVRKQTRHIVTAFKPTSVLFLDYFPQVIIVGMAEGDKSRTFGLLQTQSIKKVYAESVRKSNPQFWREY